MAEHFTLDADSLVATSESTESAFTAPVVPDVSIDVDETEGIVFSIDIGRYTFVYPLDGSSGIGGDSEASAGLLAECRICKEEDDMENLDTPCACCGSMEHAHRVCVQRWCYKKGDTTCEVCQQPYNHGYRAFDQPPHTEVTLRPLDGERRISGPEDPLLPNHHSYYGSLICLYTGVVIFAFVLLWLGTVDSKSAMSMLVVGAIMLFLHLLAKGAEKACQRRRQRRESTMNANGGLETDPLLAIRH